VKDEKRKKCLFALVETITGKNETHMNVVSNERVSTQQVSNKCGLIWMWSQTNESQINRSQMNVVSN